MKYIATVVCQFDIEIDPEEMDKEETKEYIETVSIDEVFNMRANYYNDSIEATKVLRMREEEE